MLITVIVIHRQIIHIYRDKYLVEEEKNQYRLLKQNKKVGHEEEEKVTDRNNIQQFAKILAKIGLETIKKKEKKEFIEYTN